ncbi:hypothetical protein KVT40_002424 [Elsinoe batatas]|uniref:Mediator of RNA polymerase II transcription subunit 11 n=1 Tax=Elsinoe batatas TaxID=2601811 RepID=A0A8K0LB22_9PEZI|nr:hypothetical protein KVT40_002424 [Elsinoe batatas]
MPASQPTISSTDRIRDLSSINADVPTLLSSASAALLALTGEVPPASSSPNDASPPPTTHDPQSLDAAKQAFTTNAKTYFTTLQSVMARLRRQAYALEEAGIISAEAPILASASSGPAGRIRAQGGPMGQKTQTEEERLTNGGLGGLDVAWLNSRVGKGGLEKEGEVLGEAKGLVEDALRGKREGEVEMGDA